MLSLMGLVYEGDAFEDGHLGIFVHGCDSGLDRGLAVAHLILLLLEGILLEELVQTAVGDVVDHGFLEIGGLLA